MSHETPLDLLDAGERPAIHSSIRVLADLADKVEAIPTNLVFVGNEAAHELQHAGWKTQKRDGLVYWITPLELERKITEHTVKMVEAEGHDPNNIGKSPPRPDDRGLMDACATYVWAVENGLL